MTEGVREFFQASEIARVIGMPEKRLIKFVESPGYGIKPSVRVRAGKGAPRLYSLRDVLSIALAWWLFQSGFRSQVIGRVLRDPAVSDLLSASAARKSEAANARFLVLKREMSKDEPPNQQVLLSNLDEAMSAIRLADRHGFQILPIDSLLSVLWRRLRIAGES
jgi:hypothetical protein